VRESLMSAGPAAGAGSDNTPVGRY